MKAREINPTDLNSINHWLELRAHEPMNIDALPKYGCIVPGVAAGFLRCVEGGYGIFDGLVTNPHCSSKTRNAALEAVVATIITKAEQIGMIGVIGWSVDIGTLKRAQSVGFEAIPEQLIFKELK